MDDHKSGSLVRFGEDELVSSLPVAYLVEIGGCLNSDIGQNWMDMATKLGIGNSDIERIMRLPNPGYEVLMLWKRKPKSTIRVLQNVLHSMQRSDARDLLEKAKIDPTDANIVIRYKVESRNENVLVSRNENVLVVGIPYLTALLDCARPRIHKIYGNLLWKKKLLARLLLPPGVEGSWTSPVGEFRGQQIEVELVPVGRQQTRVRNTEHAGGKEHYLSDRNCQSYVDNEALFFDLVSSQDVQQESTDSSVLFENTPQGSPNDGPVCQVESASCLQADEELINLGYHPEIPTDDTRRAKTAELLRPHSSANGTYLLRRALIANTSMALSVVYNRDVQHFSIMKSMKDGRPFFSLFTDGCEFDSVPKLIDYYKSHCLTSPTMNTPIEGLYLTTPVISFRY